MANEFSVVGKYIPKVDGPELVRGQALYSIDESLPGMLYGKILTSPHAHANIRSIDTSKAEALPGVRAVLTHKDVLPITIRNVKVLDSKVRFVGDEVAAVAAVTEEIADEALKLIDVDYEVLPAVFDPEEALKPGAPILHPEEEGNLMGGEPIVSEAGDLEAGFQQSDRIYEDVFEAFPQIIAPLGRLCAVAWWEGDRLTVIHSDQTVRSRQEELADWLGIPMSKVRVIHKFMGAGMGEGNRYRYVEMAAYLARNTGRTVKVITDTRYHFCGSAKRRARARTYLKVGVKEDGTIMSLSARIYWDKGCDNSGGPSSSRLVRSSCYKAANTKEECYSLYTNTPRNGAYRDYGRPEAFWPLNTMFDRIANDLGIDPLDYCVKHCGPSHTPKLLERAGVEFGWTAKWHKPGERTLPNGKKHGIGVAMQNAKGGPASTGHSAMIRLQQDGTAVLTSMLCDIGTGSKTSISQVAAETLGMKFDDILIYAGDTTLPLDRGSSATRLAKSQGLATYNAAQDLKSNVFKIVAPELEVSPEDLDVGDGKIFSKTDPSKSVTWKEASGLAGDVYQDGIVLGWGYVQSVDIEDTTVSWSGHMYEVEVDTETGEVTILKVLNFFDIGQCLNPGIVETQIAGCTHVALGYVITEDVVLDPETGCSLNANFLEYRLPTILELPTVDMILKDDEPNPCTPHGQRGVGEPPVGGFSGINNAIYNAIGVSSNTNPVTPDKILELLGKA